MAYQFETYRYDPVSRTLFRGEREIPLAHKARELLVLFLENPHKLLTRENFTESLWPDAAVTDDALRFQVSELRKAFGADGERFIRTVPREGYRWEVDVVVEKPASQVLASAGPACRLVLANREVTLAFGENIVGRDRNVLLWIDHTSVSRHHARIVVGDGGATLEDLGSKNGTHLRGEKIAGTVPLSDGDEIRIGPATMTFRVLRRVGSTETETEEKRR